MKAIATALAVSAFALLGACEGQTDENLAAAAGNVTADLGNELGDVAAEAENVADVTGEAIANGAETAVSDLQAEDGNEAAAENGADAQ